MGSKNTALRTSRVHHIILDEKDGRVYDALGKEESIGTILFSWVNEYSATSVNQNNYASARPLNYNISHYPVPQEIVRLIGGIKEDYMTTGRSKPYYFTFPTPVFNNPSIT